MKKGQHSDSRGSHLLGRLMQGPATHSELVEKDLWTRDIVHVLNRQLRRSAWHIVKAKRPTQSQRYGTLRQWVYGLERRAGPRVLDAIR